MMAAATNKPVIAPTGAENKIGYIDRLRVLMTVLVILHHAAVTYGAPGGWYLSDVSRNQGTQIVLTWFVATNQSFFMGFFFFLSALFTPAAYDRKGPRKFLGDRLKRLGLPLLFYSLVISPVTIWLVLKFQDGVSYSFFDFIKGFNGWINFGVLWFVAALLLFTFIYAGYRVVFPAIHRRISFPARGRIILFSIGIGLFSYLVRIFFPIGQVLKPMGFQPAHFSQYIALYLLGLIASRNRWLNQFPVMDNRFWIRFSAGMVLIGFPSLYMIKIFTGAEMSSFSGGGHLPSLLNALWEQVTGFSIIMALTGWFMRKDRPAGPLLKTMTRSAFAVYIIHPLVLVSLTLLLLSWPVPKEMKLLLVAPVATVVSFLAGSLLVKIPGLKQVI